MSVNSLVNLKLISQEDANRLNGHQRQVLELTQVFNLISSKKLTVTDAIVMANKYTFEQIKHNLECTYQLILQGIIDLDTALELELEEEQAEVLTQWAIQNFLMSKKLSVDDALQLGDAYSPKALLKLDGSEVFNSLIKPSKQTLLSRIHKIMNSTFQESKRLASSIANSGGSPVFSKVVPKDTGKVKSEQDINIKPAI